MVRGTKEGEIIVEENGKRRGQGGIREERKEK